MPDDSLPDLDIFLNAPADATDEELKHYLDEACGSDDGLRQRVESLFAADITAEEFMGQPPIAEGMQGVAAQADEDAEAGVVIGRYKLRQKIGEGGFGTVWMAEQTKPISRMVALKVVKAGMDTRQVLARFEAERQALAMMDHPSIAKVLDAGATEGGRPYFVMELVRGIPITEFCDDQKLDTRHRLELFSEVCSAVNHAHQKGIIHRDLKPSNVMVTLHDDKPVPKVIDFGIAKATEQKLTDKTIFTRFEQFLGTPAYMSPEQAAMSGLDIDTRSDVYSLGVLLYELLAGAPPFNPKTLASAGYDEMRRIIREDEPPKPSRRITETQGASGAPPPTIPPSALRGDLDWIVMKALEKERARRYETANAFAADIERHLKDEPVQAAAPSASYRIRKFARRNKVTVAATSVIGGTLLVATVVSIGQAKVARDAVDLANRRLGESEQARLEAEDIASFVTEMFEKADPQQEMRAITVSEVLHTAVTKLERGESGLGSQPSRRMNLQGVFGRACYFLTYYSKALELQEPVRDYYLETLGPDHPRSLTATANLADTYTETGREEEALKLLETVLDERRSTSGEEHPDTISSIEALAKCHENAGRLNEALPLRQLAFNLHQDLHGSKHPHTLLAMGRLALAYQWDGQTEIAKEMQMSILKLIEDIPNPDPPTIAAMHRLSFRAYQDPESRPKATESLEKLFDTSCKTLGPEHPTSITIMNTLARSYFYPDRGRRKEAIEMHIEQLRLGRIVQGESHPDTYRGICQLGIYYYDLIPRETDLALQAWSQLRDGQRANPHIYYLTGKMLFEEERYAEALAPLQDARRFHPMSHERGREIRESLVKTLDVLGLDSELAEVRRELAGEPEPLDAHLALRTAALQVWWGEYSEYARSRKNLLAESSHTISAVVADAVAKLSCLRPIDNPSERAAALKLARMAAKARTTYAWYSLCLGINEYRSGNYRAAREALGTAKRQAIETQEDPFRARITGTASFYDAMSLYKLGQGEESRTEFAEAAAAMKPLPADEKTPLADGSDHDDLILWLAYKETAELLGLPSGGIGAVVIPPDSEWRWLHPTDGVDPAQADADFHTTFFSSEFDDAAWNPGKDSNELLGGFGYGDEGFVGVDIGSPVGETNEEGKGNGHAAYFRHSFTTDLPHSNLELRCRYDDGIIIYLDGTEVARSNMIDGQEAYLLPAAAAISTENESTIGSISLGDVTLPPGRHVLAISLHNPAAPSSDLRIGGITLVEVEEPNEPTISGRWLSPNGGRIQIEQAGGNAVATGQSERVTQHWTRGVGKISGNVIKMTHFREGQQTEVVTGRISDDASRIDWSNNSTWKRTEEAYRERVPGGVGGNPEKDVQKPTTPE